MSVNSALLAQIQQGKKLKKATTNDRSGPILEGGTKSGGVKNTTAAPVPRAGGAPQLGGLFAGGMPKLKSVEQTQSSLALGKPPSIPKRSATTSVASALIVPPVPPARDASVRSVPPRPPPGTSSAPATPRRPPPPARPASPPARRPPPPARPASPPPRPNSTGPPSTLSRHGPPPPPPRPSSTQGPSLPPRKVPGPPTASGRAPPPPPPRPSSTLKTSTTPAAPSPPARTAIRPPPSRAVPQRDTEEVTTTRARSASIGGGGTTAGSGLLASLAPPPQAPIGMRGESHGRRAVSVSNVNGIGSLNGTKRVITARIPSPPLSSGPHTFPSSSDFPPPRTFARSTKKYASGNIRGCTFDVSALA